MRRSTMAGLALAPLAVLILAGCGRSSGGSGSGSSGPSSGQVNQGLSAASAGLGAALSGTSIAPPVAAAVQPDATGAGTQGQDALATFAIQVASGLLAARNQGATLQPTTTTCVNAYDCTYTNASGTVTVHWVVNTSYTQGTETITFTNFVYQGIIVNGTLTLSIACTGGPTSCAYYNGTFSGSLVFTGAIAFTLTWNETWSVTASGLTCGGFVTAGGRTYTITSSCTVSG